MYVYVCVWCVYVCVWWCVCVCNMVVRTDRGRPEWLILFFLYADPGTELYGKCFYLLNHFAGFIF